MRRAYGYVRHVFGQDAECVQAQRQSIVDYFESRLKPEGLSWGGFYEDAAASGRRELRSRTAGFDLDLELERGDAAVFATSAAFRNTRELIQIINRWTERRVTAHLLDVKLDSSTDTGKWMLRTLEFGADIKRSIYSARMRESIAYRKSIGRAASGPPPYGFKLAGKRGGRHYVPCEWTRKYGQWILQWKLMGYSYRQLYWHLVNKRYHNKKGKMWSIATLWRMCKAECNLLQQEPGGKAILERWRLAGLRSRGIEPTG